MPARGKHSLSCSDRAAPVLGNARPSPGFEEPSSVAREARDQLPQTLASALADRNPVAEQQRIEVELEQRPDAGTQGARGRP